MIDLNFEYQQSAKVRLRKAKDSDRHSVLISGCSGCGKTYLAKYYADMLNIPDFIVVSAAVDNLREATDISISSSNNIVVCVENLDTGVKGASYSILKFLEDTPPNVYLVVTVRNINAVPDTIVSRSYVVDVHMPLHSDIQSYADYKYPSKVSDCRKSPVWECIRSLTDVDTVCNMSSDNLEYFMRLKSIFDFKDNISTMSWRLQHYLDNSATPLDLVMQYIVFYAPNSHIKNLAVRCADSIKNSSVAKHVLLSKFLMDCKYTV